MAENHGRQQVGEPLLRSDGARVAAQRLPLPPREHVRHLLVRPVLEEPGEEEVAGLQQREVLDIVDVPARQEPGGLEVQQGGGDDQEFGGLVQVRGLAESSGISDELVGDLGERDLGDVELPGADELEQ